ncbi:MAG: nodulation protein NfeD [Nitrospina sp.]|jgi:membrane-bound serine protease (ClpP class)|nr:nodulation protein NfeD [Nitrospina sp.]MBT3511284.1 nodulation protein NfeD [Nitrospina sp.]MBT3875075.1 nodulation protein NfeD [Nitrospina sp.]MBT4047492.1 nodulation protein NfeD [Nitrospina sp.]MBT4558151.1 nodulation protein NfeD [Nitrospina sp.]
MKKQIGFLLLIWFLIVSPAHSKDLVIVVKISGAINPAVAEYVSHEISQANADQEALIVLHMDTPGGLDTSMRQIIKKIQGSQVPVASFVAPSGSRAASAGTFITIASHIAAMAPGTNIGAAHPVNMMGGEQAKTMEQKVVNDAAAYIRSLAELRKRNARWAELAVVKSVSISAEEAKRLNVIDFIAGDVKALALAVDGREIQVASGSVTLKTGDLPIVYHEMNPRQRFLDIISNPNVAYILMMLGLVGLYFELSSPGLILPGVIGAISLILALYAMQTLPINYAGLLLILFGVILFIAEINIMSYGLLSVSGVISIFLGSTMLIDSDDPALQISRAILYPTLGMTVVLSIGIIVFATRTRNLKKQGGIEGMLGETGLVKESLNPHGRVLIHGELWEAECEGEIAEGENVSVDSVEGLKIKVSRTQNC